MAKKTVCVDCGHVFTKAEKGNTEFGLECPHCDWTVCEHCAPAHRASSDFCPKCGMAMDGSATRKPDTQDYYCLECESLVKVLVKGRPHMSQEVTYCPKCRRPTWCLRAASPLARAVKLVRSSGLHVTAK